jgi:DNA-directed RNA polymerase specialized sigma24 family protein
VNPSAVAAASPRRHLAAVPDAGRLNAKYSAQVLAYCRHNLGSRSDAEDALRTTFLLAHRALRRGVVPECESAWLTTIAGTVCRAQHRTRSRRAFVPESVDPATLPEPADEDRSRARRSVASALTAAVRRLLFAYGATPRSGSEPSAPAPY